jgi:hypothetical protein
MKMKKCFCSSCGRNFGNDAMFFEHRVGDYGGGIYAPGDIVRKNPIAQGPSTRRCMTDDEMYAIGWTLLTVPVDVIIEERHAKRDMPTWHRPGMHEDRLKKAERMKAISFKQSRKK